MLLNFKIQSPESWRDLAKQLEKESDPDRICALSKELIAAYRRANRASTEKAATAR